MTDTIEAAPPPRSVEEVKAMLEGTEKGGVRNSIHNCLTVFQYDPILSGAVAKNLLTERIDLLKPIGRKRRTGSKAMTDTDMKYILRRMEKYGISSEKKIESAIRIVANENRYHPIRDYLNGLKWDGTERIAHVLHHFLGAAEDEYTCEAMKIFLLGAIKRVFQPGCKFETMLCLVGGQGVGKSTFFRLLADGKVFPGTPDAQRDDRKYWPVALIQREEHDGTRRYYIGEEDVRIVSGTVEKDGTFTASAGKEPLSFPRADFGDAAEIILHLLRNEQGEEVEVSEGLEAFLDAVNIYDLESRTDDRTDFSVAFWSADAPLTGFTVRCRLSRMNPLLDGGRTANLKLEQSGVKFAVPTVNKVNALPESPMEVAERMMMIERLGGVLKYSDVADRVFRCNLLMIDLHFPRMLAEMVRLMHLDGITRISELTERIKEMNPLKIKDELINKHRFYEFKMKQFLLALATGMRPAKIYNGTDSAVEGMLLTNGDGGVLCYHKSDRQTFADFLYRNTRFEKGSVDKDKYGFLERENGVYYFKLNVKIGLVKR